ncbi:uncharacterized protein LOC135342897 [Halichondria panicea]|uniref:uncharacterized protein LOC135342897 n=1 Tax=Halichondria panicea TaxID=6063 RepID=UPI00312BA0F9
MYNTMEKRFHCEHCNEKISKALYYQHKQLYYSSAANSWTCDLTPGHDIHRAEQEFSFSDDEMEETSCEGNESTADTETVYEQDQDDNIMSSSTSGEEDTDDDFEVDADDDDTQLTELWFDNDTDDDENTTVKGSQVESAVLRMARLYAVFILMWQTLFNTAKNFG